MHVVHACSKYGPLKRSPFNLPSFQRLLRYYSTPSTADSANTETVRVTYGNAGRRWVNLSIRRPPSPERNNPIIIYFRRGIAGLPSPKTIYHLALSANAIVVNLEYGLSEHYPYPGPVHDVLAGYDWVKENLAGCQDIENNHVNFPKIGVCGELIGGSLAAMLALTECQVSNKSRIRAAAIGNPTVDWTALFPLIKYGSLKTEFRNVTDPLSLNNLLLLRRTLFRKPEGFFDPFASPLLYFRTPSYDLPPPPPNYPGMDEDAQPSSREDDPEPKVKKRRSHRTYPPSGTRLILPTMRVYVGQDSVLRDQGMELAELTRKSIARDEDGDVDKNKRVEAFETEGTGLWDAKQTIEIGQWLGQILREA